MFDLRTEKDSEIRNDHGQVVAVVGVFKTGILLREIELKGCLHRPDSVSTVLIFVKDKVTHTFNKINPYSRLPYI